jgi:hypothetical protein
MKLHRSLLILSALVLMLAALAPPVASGQNAGRLLSNAAARKAALPVAWDVARRNPAVNSVKLHGCDRRAANRFVCLAFDRGSTSTTATTCRVWIRIEGTDARSTATQSLIDCKNHRFALLRAVEAAAAMHAEAQKLGGPEALFSMNGRLSRVELAGDGGWLRPARADPTKHELCVVELRATLVGEQVQVRVARGPDCAFPLN